MAIKLLIPLFFILISTALAGDRGNNSITSFNNARELLKKNHSIEIKKINQQIKNAETIDPEEYSEEFKKLNFRVYTFLAQILSQYKTPLPEQHKNRKLFSTYREKLSNLEYEEIKVERLFDHIQNHFKKIEDKQYSGHWRFFIDYISWQYSAVLNKPTGKSDLVVTNKGICPGVNYARENKFFSFSFDACYLQTSGGVSSIDPTVTYIQSNISASGIKSSFAAGYFVSSSRVEVGFKIPVMLVTQDLQDPPAIGYKVKEGTNLIPMLGLYSRWPLGSYFFQTEFSRYLGEEQTQWALGIGRKF